MSEIADYIKVQGLEQIIIKVGRNVIWPERKGINSPEGALNALNTALEDPSKLKGTVTISDREGEVYLRVANGKTTVSREIPRTLQPKIFASEPERTAPVQVSFDKVESKFIEFSLSANNITQRAEVNHQYNQLSSTYAGKGSKIDRDRHVIREACKRGIPQDRATYLVAQASPEVQAMTSNDTLAADITKYLVSVSSEYTKQLQAENQREVRANYPENSTNYVDIPGALKMAIQRAAHDIEITAGHFDNAKRNLETIATKTADSDFAKWAKAQSIPIQKASEKHLDKAKTWLRTKAPEMAVRGRDSVMGAVKKIASEKIQVAKENFAQTRQTHARDMPDHPLEKYGPILVQALGEKGQYLKYQMEQGSFVIREASGVLVYVAGEFAKDVSPHIKKYLESLPDRYEASKKFVSTAGNILRQQKERGIDR
jgi:hypothetical protein